MENNPVFRSDYDYDSGKRTVIDQNSFYSLAGEKATFWVRNRHWFCLVGGLVVGSLLTICISYPFYSMGIDRLKSRMCVKQQFSAMTAGQTDHSLVKEKLQNITAHVEETLTHQTQEAEEISQNMMEAFFNMSSEEYKAIAAGDEILRGLIRAVQENCEANNGYMIDLKSDISTVGEIVANINKQKIFEEIQSVADHVLQKLKTLANHSLDGQMAVVKLLNDIKNGFVALSTGSDIKFGGNETDMCMRDCRAWLEVGKTDDAVYCINPDGGEMFNVYCDMTTDGGGWVVFQRRIDGDVDFFRGWQEYEDGFGDVTDEFWLGNDRLHRLTEEPTELRVDLMAWDGEERYAKYSSFKVGDLKSKYTLDLGAYSGNAGDSLAYHHNIKFSTKDADNSDGKHSCALRNKGAWWYNRCSHSSLNGQYLVRGVAQNMGINWQDFKGDYYSLKRASMMLRRK